MAKVKLPREVVEALARVESELGWSNEIILAKVYGNKWEAKWSQSLNVDDNKAYLIAQALVNGYEIERTPEEKLREYYVSLHRRERNEADHGGTGSHFRQGWQSVEKTVEILAEKYPEFAGVLDRRETQ